MKAYALLLAIGQVGLVLVASIETPPQVPWDLYHRTNGILEYFKKTALKLPSRVR